MLACDALYLCAGLGAYTVKKHFDFRAWFEAFLGPALEALVSSMQASARQVIRHFSTLGRGVGGGFGDHFAPKLTTGMRTSKTTPTWGGHRARRRRNDLQRLREPRWRSTAPV